MPKKRCTNCKSTYPLEDEFWGKKQRHHKGRKTNHLAYTASCRKCKNQRAREWRAKQPAAKLRAIQQRNRKHRIAKYGMEAEVRRTKRIKILRHYGLTLEQYDQRLKAQGGVCAICSASPNDQPFGVLSVDHNHHTKKIRELTCTRCNSGMAMFEDNWRLMELAVIYLKKHSKRAKHG